jgi:uncharacterized protein with NRDE domain
MNRDDAAARVEAPPRLQRISGVVYAAPVDAQSGGTWIAVNAHGVAACLLNRYDDAAVGAWSRGQIVPAAMSACDAEGAAAIVHRMERERFAPFTCVLLSARQAFRMEWNGARLETAPVRAALPWMMTSSSWRLQEVRKQRDALFRNVVVSATDAPETAVSAFHTARNPEHDCWAPMMLRDASETKSITQIALHGDECELRYWSRASALARGLTEPDVSIGIASARVTGAHLFSGGRQTS